LLLCGVAGAQSANGKIEGKITDAVTNAGLADVVVTATSPALQGEQTVVTDSAGEFEIPQLPPGAYLLHMEKENYKPLNQPNVTVRVDKTIRVTLKIAPESLKSEEVVVVGTSAPRRRTRPSRATSSTTSPLRRRRARARACGRSRAW
jgi:hypothetical protein